MSNEFGPQTYQIKKVIEKFKTLTPAQIASLDASLDASRAASRDASWAASRGASWAASRAASRDASWAASWDASRAASWDASWAMRDVVEALHSRDLIGNKFTQAHYDYLVLPWRQIVGEFEEPPTVEPLEKRVDKLEKRVDKLEKVINYGLPWYAVSLPTADTISANVEYLCQLGERKKKAREELKERYETQKEKLYKGYQVENDNIERMR